MCVEADEELALLGLDNHMVSTACDAMAVCDFDGFDRYMRHD